MSNIHPDFYYHTTWVFKETNCFVFDVTVGIVDESPNTLDVIVVDVTRDGWVTSSCIGSWECVCTLSLENSKKAVVTIDTVLVLSVTGESG